MGLFSRLFGGSGYEPKASSGESGVGIGMLRTSRTGGYDKMAVLAALDSLNKEIIALTEAKEAKDAGKAYSLPAAADIQLNTVKAGGFDEEDVDRYISELKQKINELRAQL